MIKNLAEFKRALTQGSKWDTFHYQNGVRTNIGIRAVIHAQKNAVAFESQKSSSGSWFWFPKAKSCEFKDNAIFIYWEDSKELVLEYRQVAA